MQKPFKKSLLEQDQKSLTCEAYFPRLVISLIFSTFMYTATLSNQSVYL